MTPQEKAKQLFGKYYGIPLYIKTVKECCHIAVNEILECVLPSSDLGGDISKHTIEYWNQVKQEIEKL